MFHSTEYIRHCEYRRRWRDVFSGDTVDDPFPKDSFLDYELCNNCVMLRFSGHTKHNAQNMKDKTCECACHLLPMPTETRKRGVINLRTPLENCLFEMAQAARVLSAGSTPVINFDSCSVRKWKFRLRAHPEFNIKMVTRNGHTYLALRSKETKK